MTAKENNSDFRLALTFRKVRQKCKYAYYRNLIRI